MKKKKRNFKKKGQQFYNRIGCSKCAFHPCLTNGYCDLCCKSIYAMSYEKE